MRHKVYGKHLGRDKNQRTALFRSLVRSLFLEESITTTEVKAKAIKGLVDKLISDSIKGTSASLTSVQKFLPQKQVSKKLIEEIAPSFKTRQSGFTSVVRLGNRLGDGAMLVKMSLIKDAQDPESRIKNKEAGESKVVSGIESDKGQDEQEKSKVKKENKKGVLKDKKA